MEREQSHVRTCEFSVYIIYNFLTALHRRNSVVVVLYVLILVVPLLFLSSRGAVVGVGVVVVGQPALFPLSHHRLHCMAVVNGNPGHQGANEEGEGVLPR